MIKSEAIKKGFVDAFSYLLFGFHLRALFEKFRKKRFPYFRTHYVSITRNFSLRIDVSFPLLYNKRHKIRVIVKYLEGNARWKHSTPMTPEIFMMN